MGTRFDAGSVERSNSFSLDVIFCGHFLWNEQSHRVQEKSGFKHYGFDTYETAFGTTEENEVNILKREDWVLQ